MKKAINWAKGAGWGIAVWTLPVMALAQTIQQPAPPTGVAKVPQSNITSLQSVLVNLCVVFAWMFYFLIVLAIIFVIVAAFKYLTAAGNPEKVKSAGTMLLYTAVAIGVALLAKAIPLIVGSFLGANGQVSSC